MASIVTQNIEQGTLIVEVGGDVLGSLFLVGESEQQLSCTGAGKSRLTTTATTTVDGVGRDGKDKGHS